MSQINVFVLLYVYPKNGHVYPVYPKVFPIVLSLKYSRYDNIQSNGKKAKIRWILYSYIRVTHQRKTSYIKTNKIIDPAHITSSGELTDPVVNEYCAIIIRQYTDKLNRVDATFWELKDVIEFLHKNDEETCFSDYARSLFRRWNLKGMNVMLKTINLQSII